MAHYISRRRPVATATMTDDGTWTTEADIPEKERYQRYLCSREWAVLKEQVKKRSGGVCERCRLVESAAVHHLTYARKYQEELEDLQDICEPCHQFTHGKSDDDPISIRLAILRGIFATDSRMILVFRIIGGATNSGEAIIVIKQDDAPSFSGCFGKEETTNACIDVRHYLDHGFLINLDPDDAEEATWFSYFGRPGNTCPGLFAAHEGDCRHGKLEGFAYHLDRAGAGKA